MKKRCPKGFELFLRNIRSAVEMAFDRSTPAVLERYFGK